MASSHLPDAKHREDGSSAHAGDRRTKIFVVGFVAVLVLFGGAVGVSKWLELQRGSGATEASPPANPR